MGPCEGRSLYPSRGGEAASTSSAVGEVLEPREARLVHAALAAALVAVVELGLEHPRRGRASWVSPVARRRLGERGGRLAHGREVQGWRVEAPQRRPLHDAVIPAAVGAAARLNGHERRVRRPQPLHPVVHRGEGQVVVQQRHGEQRPVFGRRLQLHDQRESSQYGPRRPTTSCHDVLCCELTRAPTRQLGPLPSPRLSATLGSLASLGSVRGFDGKDLWPAVKK